MSVIASKDRACNLFSEQNKPGKAKVGTKLQQSRHFKGMPVYVGDALIGHRVTDKKLVSTKLKKKFNLCLCRLREIEKIIRHRHELDGNIVPHTDDASIYARLVACIMYIEYGADAVEKLLKDWMRRWYPWADQKYVDSVVDEIHPHFTPLSPEYLARHLHLTFAERTLLNIRTIGACDVSRNQRQKIRREKHKQKDREAKKSKRQANGAVPREKALSRTRPWEAEGISRSTWDRRHRAIKKSKPH